MSAFGVLVRWAHLLPLLGIFGASAFSALLKRKDLIGERLVLRGFQAAAWLTLVTALLQLPLTVGSMGGEPLDASEIGTVLSETAFGHAFEVRFAAVAALLAVAVVRRSGGVVAAVLSGIALVTIAVTSHAAASGPEAYALLRLSTDALHLLTAGFWIGGLWVLLDLGLRGRREKPQLLFRAVSLFADVAIYGVTALFLAGMLNTGFILSAQHVDAWYGVLLALKVVLAFAMIGIAFVNRLRVTPRLASGEGGEVLARNVRGELVLGAAVVAIAAVLGSISPG